jgi:transposase
MLFICSAWRTASVYASTLLFCHVVQGNRLKFMRAGAEYFVQPGVPAQRRYEALRCYFVEQLSAAEVGERFGYSPATVHQLAAELRAGRSEFFVSAKPGPKGPRKSSATIRDRVLVLRAGDHSVTEIADRLTAEGSPVSAQTVWGILHAEGLERLPRRRTRAGPTPRTGPVKARPIESWPAGASWPCDHAGLYLLLPAMVELGLDTLIDAAGYPSTRVLSAVHSVGSLLLLKCSRRGRAANAFPLGADPGLGLALGLVALPKATHLTGYSYRVRRQANLGLLTELARRCRDAGLYTGEAGFNLDFHAIRHHGDEVPLEEHYLPARSQRTPLEGEPAEQRLSGLTGAVEVLEELGGPVDRLDDDPLVGDAAQRLSLDDLAGQPVAQMPGTELLGGTTAADPEFHQLTRAHPGDRGDGDDRGGADDADHGDGLRSVHG